MIKRPIQLSHDFLAEVLESNSIAVDATMGNGNDTVFLAGLASKVYAFDVQEQALQKTKERLEQLGFDNAQLILDGHQTIDKYVDGPIRAAIFNLGYLPSADKTIITKPDTTLEAIGKILDRLEVGGRISIMIYYDDRYQGMCLLQDTPFWMAHCFHVSLYFSEMNIINFSKNFISPYFKTHFLNTSFQFFILAPQFRYLVITLLPFFY